MKYTNKLMLMIATFLYGDCDAERFSFEFPDTLSAYYDALQEENAALCDYLEEEMPEVCAAYDPHGTGAPDTMDARQLRLRVLEIYQKALPLSMRPAS